MKALRRRVSPTVCRRKEIRFLGGYSGEVTPVPIPNTEVKLSRADDTASATRWESRSPPGLIQKAPSEMTGLFTFYLQKKFIRFILPRQGTPIFNQSHPNYILPHVRKRKRILRVRGISLPCKRSSRRIKFHNPVLRGRQYR